MQISQKLVRMAINNYHQYHFTEICIPLRNKVCRFHHQSYRNVKDIQEIIRMLYIFTGPAVTSCHLPASGSCRPRQHFSLHVSHSFLIQVWLQISWNSPTKSTMDLHQNLQLSSIIHGSNGNNMADSHYCPQVTTRNAKYFGLLKITKLVWPHPTKKEGFFVAIIYIATYQDR